MALKIVEFPNPVLRRATTPVTEFDASLRTLVDEMTMVMMDDDGVGLAAPQVGISKKLAVVMIDNVRYVLANPVIVESSGTQKGDEGCLSFPGKYGYVTRPDVVTVRAQDRNGEWFEVTGEHLTARAFLHEIDHLDSHVFIEKVSEFIETE